GGSVTIEGVDGRVREGGQGDARFFELLQVMGCGVSYRGGAVAVRRIGELHGVRANVKDCSDVFPTLAIVATQASEATELTGIGPPSSSVSVAAPSSSLSDRPTCVPAEAVARGSCFSANGPSSARER